MLADFGLGQAMPKRGLGASHYRGGTWNYTAPECLLAKRFGFRADRYSMGAVIWEFIEGMCPYENESELMGKRFISMHVCIRARTSVMLAVFSLPFCRDCPRTRPP